MALKENYKDDILDVSVNTKRKYRMTENQDGTVSFDDETEYLQEGDNFGSGAINPIAHAINGLNNYNFHPSGSIDLVAYIADDSYYLNEDNKYVLADSPTGQALITSEPSTYKALASNTDLYGIEGEDTVSGFEPSSTPITVEGQTLSTIDDKLNYLIESEPTVKEVAVIQNGTASSRICFATISNLTTKVIKFSRALVASSSITNLEGEYLSVSVGGSTTVKAKKAGKYAVYKLTSTSSSGVQENYAYIGTYDLSINDNVINESWDSSKEYYIEALG